MLIAARGANRGAHPGLRSVPGDLAALGALLDGACPDAADWRLWPALRDAAKTALRAYAAERVD